MTASPALSGAPGHQRSAVAGGRAGEDLEPGTEVLVSAASAWEISTETRLGRLDGDPLLSAWSKVIADMMAVELPIDASDGILAGRLPWDHRDPFDRVLVAQAARRNLTIATSDARIISAALTATVKT